MARKKVQSFEELLEYKEIDETIHEKGITPSRYEQIVEEPQTDQYTYENETFYQSPHETKRKRRQALWQKYTKRIVLIALILIAYFFLRQHIETIMHVHPAVWTAYSHIVGEIAESTLLGFFYVALFGSLFFIALPIEVVFVYYLTLDYPLVVLIFAGVVGTVSGNIFNYFFGRLLGERSMRYLFKNKYDKYKKIMEKVGPIILIGGNITPFPMELVSIIYGAMKYKFGRFVFFTMIGKLTKFSLIFIGYVWFTDYFIPWYEATAWAHGITAFFKWIGNLF